MRPGGRAFAACLCLAALLAAAIIPAAADAPFAILAPVAALAPLGLVRCPVACTTAVAPTLLLAYPLAPRAPPLG